MMKLYKTISAEHAGKAYEVRILYDQKQINIVTFHNRYPANGFRYQILLSKNDDVEKLLRMEQLSHLIEKAMDDIREDRWQAFNA